MKTKFSQVRRTLNRIPNIDMGGCGIAAYAMYKWLKEHGKLSDDFAFVYLYGNHIKDVYRSNCTIEKRKKGVMKACSHAIIRYKGEYMDSDTKQPLLCWDRPWHQHVTDPTLIATSVARGQCWNTDFDRSTYLPIIEQRLGIDLSELRN